MKHESTIGKILVRLRERNGYTQQQLCHKLCSVSSLAKIESGKNPPEHFLLNRLLERLGQSTAKLEYVLSHEEYMLYEFQYRIHEELSKNSFSNAMELLRSYSMMEMKHEGIKRQYIEQTEAQIMWMMQAPLADVLAKLDTAIGRTMDAHINWKSYDYALSAEEVRLFLFRQEITAEASEEDVLELLAILEYIDRHHTDVEEKVKVYPYAVILLGKELIPYKGHNMLKPYVERALKLLRGEGRLIFLTEIMELYIQILRETGGAEVETTKYERQLDTVRHLLNDTGLQIERYRLFPIWDKEYSLDYETIRRQRTAYGITQSQLSEGICEPETLSRIESGRRKPSHRHYGMLADKLGRNTGRVQIGLGITAYDFDTVLLRRELEKLLHRLEWDAAERVADELEERLDCSIVANRQYIMQMKIYLKNVRGEITNVDARHEFVNLLELSLGNTPLLELPKFALNRLEINLMNHVAIMYMKEGKRREAIAIYEAILEGYHSSEVKEVFHIREISTILANLADLYEEVNFFDKAKDLSEKRIQISILLAKGNDLGRALTTIAFTMERQGNRACVAYYKQALEMLDLMEMKARYQIVKKHFNTNFP